MTTTLTNTRTLEISGMTGDACIQKVTAALRAVPGITPQTVKLGLATITSDLQAKTDAAIAAVVAAGFKARQIDAVAPANNVEPVRATPIPVASATAAAVLNKAQQAPLNLPANAPQPVVAVASPAHV